MLALIRHGATIANEARRLQGKIENKLSDIGLLQARRIALWATQKGFVKVLSSDSLRASQTAQIISEHLGVPFTLHSELRERDYSTYDGLTIAEITKIRVDAGHVFVDATQDWFGITEVEGDNGVFARVSGLIKSVYLPSSPDNLLLVTHAGVIKSYLHITFAISPERSNCFKVPNGAVLLLDYDQGGNMQLRGFYPQIEGAS
jgi:broad specificity phosphatase PhoE